AEFLALQFGGDVEHRPALRHDDNMDINVSACDLIENLAGSLRALEEIFAGLKAAAAMAFADEVKGKAAVNYAISEKKAGSAPARSTARNIHKNLRGGEAAIGAVHFLAEPESKASGEHEQNHECDGFFHGRMSRTGGFGASGFGLEIFAKKNRCRNGVEVSTFCARRFFG